MKYADKRCIFNTDFISLCNSFYPASASELTVARTLFDFPVYFRFFVGLFALVSPVGITPVFISVTSHQTAAARNKTNLTANLLVAITLWTSLSLGDGILQLFGISIDSFGIAGSILVVIITMSMIGGKLGEGKQNRQEKSETVVRESTGVVPLALPLMVGPGAISSTTAWGTRYRSAINLFGFFIAVALFVLCCWGLFRMTPWLMRLLGQTGINVIMYIMGLLLMALGIEFIVAGVKPISPGLLI